MKRNHKEHVLDGIKYVCHKWDTQIALSVFGANAFMVVNDEAGERIKINPEMIGAAADMMPKVLKACMISPKLGDVDDPASDTVTWLTMADHGPRLFTMITGGDSKQAENFPASSEGQQEL